jgi:hypothetical protein
LELIEKTIFIYNGFKQLFVDETGNITVGGVSHSDCL